jgi:hypothetical protein
MAVNWLKMASEKARDPKATLTLLLDVVALLASYYFVYIYQNMLGLNIPFVSYETLIAMPIIAAVVIPLIHYLLVRSDPLQRSPRKGKSIRFFQSEFPSNYLLRRCERCVESPESCPNYISEDSKAHVSYWFDDIFHGPIEKEDPGAVRATFERGYTCKLIYYVTWILWLFVALSVIVMVIHHLRVGFSVGRFQYELTAQQVLSPILCILLIALLKVLHQPNPDAPSGCWQAWQEINRMHVHWMRQHEDYLVDLICRANDQDKSFRERWMIVTHASPDLDCIVATWLLKRFGGMSDSPIEFVRFSDPIPKALKNAVFVDIGGGDLDHHQRTDFVSSATLVLEKLSLQHNPALSRLADIARKIDHGIFDSDSQGVLNLVNIIAGLNKIHPDDPSQVMSIALECLDAIYLQETEAASFDKELQKAVTFSTRWGPGIALTTTRRGIRHYCHRKGFPIFVYLDPLRDYRGFAAPGGRGVDFSEIYEKLRRIEPQAEWYLHFTKDLLICGSDKAANRHLSKLSLKEMIALVRGGVNDSIPNEG